MAKPINEWVFIIIGLVVVAVSIYFYNTLKLFIVLGSFMCLYGLGKMSYNQMKNKIFPKDEEEPVDLNKVPNPYLGQQSQLPQRVQQPQHVQQRQVQHHIVHRQHSQQAHHSAVKYCHSCGQPVHKQHRFCASCGARLL